MGDLISFTNNGILHIFDNIKYLLSSAEIESVFNPGTVSNIIELAKYPNSFQKGLIQCWEPDSSNDLADTNTVLQKEEILSPKVVLLLLVLSDLLYR